MRIKKKQCYFAVGIGRERGVHSSVVKCKNHSIGFPYAHYRKFKTLEEAQAYVEDFSHVPDGSRPDEQLLKKWKHLKKKVLSDKADTTKQFASNHAIQPLQNSFTSQEEDNLNLIPSSTKKRSSSEQEGPKIKIARKSNPECDDPQSARINDDSNRSLDSEPSKKESDKSKKKLQKLKEELERLKEKQAKMEADILKIVQHIQEKTEGMEILKAEIASVERRVSLIEAGKPSSLKEAVSRIGIYQENRLEEKVKRSKPQPPIVKTEPSFSAKAERIESDEENQMPISDFSYDSDNYCVVYTAGVCHNKGQDDVKAGLGVFFGDGNKYNMNEPLTDCPPSNSNAGILAATLACNVAKLSNISKINFHIDSTFLKRCALEWIPEWEKIGWESKLKITTKCVSLAQKNQIRRLRDAMQGLEVKWTYVRWHFNGYGNKMANQLANEGAEKYGSS